jgi:hypothetical protein
MGHMIIYRNTYENNRVFNDTYKIGKLYKEVLPHQRFAGLMKNGTGKIILIDISCFWKKSFTRRLSANFNVNVQNFERNLLYVDDLTGKIVHTREGKINALDYWDNGGAYRLYINNGKLIKEEFLYMHFQWRICILIRGFFQIKNLNLYQILF